MKEEKIFPIMNKFDKIWSDNVDKTFCEIYKEITNGEMLTDKEFSKRLTKYIDKQEDSVKEAKAKKRVSDKEKEDNDKS
jgi:deoxyhypusine synthase